MPRIDDEIEALRCEKEISAQTLFFIVGLRYGVIIEINLLF
jgi:hypothetical protein